MRVFDLVGNIYGQRAGTRVAVIGTCRILSPFEQLMEVGRATRVWLNHDCATDTFGEALQAIRYTRGEIDIPDAFRPLVFSLPNAHVRSDVDRRALESVDAVFVEISDLRHISHDPFYFQANSFYREFVSKYGAPLLPWYRAFSLGLPITEELVATAMEKLADRSAGELVEIEKVLRHTTVKTTDVSSALDLLDKIVFDRAKRWILVSHFSVPGMGGTQMADRSRLIEVVQDTAVKSGVAMFDPTVILKQLGREAALASEGRDIYHYNPNIYEFVGDELLRAGGLITGTPVAGTGREVRKVSRPAAEAAEWVNSTLMQLHTERVASMGVDESGLYAHYKGLLDKGQLAGPSESMLGQLLLDVLPRFECYDVLRAGLGEMAFLLARLGLRVGGYEPNPNRFAAMYSGMVKFGNDDPDMMRRITIGQTVVPDVPPKSDTIGVVHHLIGFRPDQEDGLLDQLANYDALLLDPRIFVFSRKTEQEKAAITESLRKRGFTQVREFPSHSYTYYAKAGVRMIGAISEALDHLD